MSDTTAAYLALTEHLAKQRYSFVCPSPETQGRVVQKRISDASTAEAKNATDFFGWNLPCSRDVLKSIVPGAVFTLLLDASIITSGDGEEIGSTIRVSDFYLPTHKADARPLYYIHSSFPASSDSVFFGPDTYLFVAFLQTAVRHLSQTPYSVIDVCCGSGAGAIHLAKMYPEARAMGLDLNPRALRLGNVNARLASTTVDFHESNLYAAVPEQLRSDGIDLIVSNPPYIASSSDGEDLPIYADGGAEFGLDISLRIVEEGMKILSSRGVIIVYTGVAIPAAKPGHDAFLEKLKIVEGAELVEYTIIHPDMWPEEIGRGAYAGVGRIQAVGAVLRRSV
ncbi:S-adenosyl-L-methionine-dependent methyltransferase [Paraphoma chrysanthemicola]|uniref:S-adenosyl-L-methionine-dependent methyltransferase n=1 Tax=Paraphoma chrysanthemicola TaxID=798071 RepID=A0A8K0RF83_9PLEO|nr:S-adenosyl-L-methionine-dependent methyltransferase [Paraphoma chrysanthemicola]